MHILFACGGTGGHINPALAVAGYIRELHPDAQISFVGNKSGMESTLVPKAGYDFYPIHVAGFQRKITPKNICRNVDALVKMFTSSAEASALLKRLKPDVVVGMGGYVSGPVLRKAHQLGIKTATHEQNAFPGITTKALLKYVDTVMLAMPDAQKRLPDTREYVITGNPVRGELLVTTRQQARKHLGIDPEGIMVLSFGGSLGAKRINEVVAASIAQYTANASVYHYHATGKFGKEWMPAMVERMGCKIKEHRNLRVTEYIHDMNFCMAAADLVICRAGAITLSELAAQGKASILIPSPNVAENHQYHNAMTLGERDAAVVIEEKDLTEELLIQTVSELVAQPQKLKEMGQNAKKVAITDACQRIYDQIIKLVH